jgi:hypothetical protein
LPDGAYLSACQELVTCRNAPRVAACCRTLWRPKGKKKATGEPEGWTSCPMVRMARGHAAKYEAGYSDAMMSHEAVALA